jgi:hypothetical protein
MSKKKDQTRPAPKAEPKRERPALKAQSYFHFVAMAEDYYELLARVIGTDPTALQQAGPAMNEIMRAQGPNQVVGLTSAARGAAQVVWMRRMREFGAEALPAIVRRLKSSQSIVNEQSRHMVVERLTGALRQLGQPGGQALLDCFNSLDTYSQSVACVALGVLHVEQAADLIWNYYERIKADQTGGNFVGALWGLVDLQYPGTSAALADLMTEGYQFAELFGLVARAGGQECVAPLVERLAPALSGPGNYDAERDDIVMALSAVANRLGRATFQGALVGCLLSERSIEILMESAYARTPEDVSNYFEAYFRNPSDALIKALTSGM